MNSRSRYNYLPKIRGFMNEIGMEEFLVDLDFVQEEKLLMMIRNMLKNDETRIILIKELKL
jgi:polysaccharide pyruvyl transferase WcaK-like protein